MRLAHLFFDCIVASQAWSLISEVFHIQIGVDYESMAKHWLCNKKFGTVNAFSSALCWGLWEFVVFPGSCLAGDEDGVANGDSDVEMLENLNTSKGYGWL
jgi:hypothetical protein